VDAELECEPFFVDLNKLPTSQLAHLQQSGLLLVNSNDKESSTSDNDNDHRVLLLRSKHLQYLSQVWQTPPSAHMRPPLRSGFVSLDASRPWILYWCLHGTDLLSVGTGNSSGDDRDQDLDQSYVRMVQTMEKCFQRTTVTLPDHLLTEWLDQDPLFPTPISQSLESGRRLYQAGGFGGGPGQMAHAATTYAGILALCIIATSPLISKQASEMAFSLLERIRPSLYVWMLSLQQPDGSYRMHLDGEVDVRASYTIFVCAKLLNILDMAPTGKDHPRPWRQQVSKLLLIGGPHELAVSYLAQCQTYEGGLGGVPHVEAHGGYTFCGAAALQLVNRLHALDVDSLLAWLARRQMAYEGGFSGRTNKLVDACYSFWQAGALAIACQNSHNKDAEVDFDYDPWLGGNTTSSPPDHAKLLLDVPMLERYILLCGQDVNGGLRDKPSKQRDFYHSCYALSGLSILQHYAGTEIADVNGDETSSSTPDQQPPSQPTHVDSYGHRPSNLVSQTHPCYNIHVNRVQQILGHFRQLDNGLGS
jgi:prenyltransferase beta subunit